MTRSVGVLALQGCVEPHFDLIRQVGARAAAVRTEEDLENVDALILPGGESTTMLRLMKYTNLPEAIKEFATRSPIWGICAGAILLASVVENPEQESFSLMPIRASRNAYGSQSFSFKAHVESPWDGSSKCVDFIRAPKLSAESSEVQQLVSYHSEGVLFQQGHILASAFHTELGTDPWLHEYLLSLVSY